MRRRAFTLVEILVVVGILVILAGVLIPTVGKAWKQAKKTTTASNMGAIVTALQAYKADHGDYPQVRKASFPAGFQSTPDRPNPRTGAQVLCQALLAPAPAGENPGYPTDAAGNPLVHVKRDGKDGAGFTSRNATFNTSTNKWEQQGKGYGPYLAESFKTTYEDPNTTGDEPLLKVIADAYGRPILYFPARGAWNRAAYVGRSTTELESFTFDLTDNFEMFRRPSETDQAVIDRMTMAFGDTDHDGVIDTTEKPRHEGAYVLWSAGPDELYGPDPGMSSPGDVFDQQDVDKSDDITVEP